jgi:hypothetical protein
LYPIKAPKASDENVFTLLELISCFPDLNNEFRLWQESEISYLKVDSLNFIEEDKIIELKISKLNELFLESLFPKAYYDILEID